MTSAETVPLFNLNTLGCLEMSFSSDLLLRSILEPSLNDINSSAEPVCIVSFTKSSAVFTTLPFSRLTTVSGDIPIDATVLIFSELSLKIKIINAAAAVILKIRIAE